MSLSPVCVCASSATPTRTAEQPRHALYPSSITDAQWLVLSRLLPVPGNTAGRGGRPEKHDRRRVLDAIFYLVRGGLSWRQLPAEYPPWQSVYALFRRWHATGAWHRVHQALYELLRLDCGRRPWPSAAVIDSQSVRAGMCVPRTGADRRGYDGGKKVNGRKRHLAVDTSGLVLAVLITAANVPDRNAAFSLLGLLRERFSTIKVVWADSGYRGRLITWTRKVLRLHVEVVAKPSTTGFVVAPRRWVVERTFAWLFTSRRLLHDHERHASNHEAMIYIAMIMLMSRRLARTANP